jgi:hypothetical protein
VLYFALTTSPLIGKTEVLLETKPSQVLLHGFISSEEQPASCPVLLAPPGAEEGES